MVGSAINFQPANATITAPSVSGANGYGISITGGANTTGAFTAGGVTITGGNGGTTNAAQGGSVSLLGGDTGGVTTGGSVTISSGAGWSGGQVNINSPGSAVQGIISIGVTTSSEVRVGGNGTAVNIGYHAAAKVGFFTTASAVKQTVSGAKGGNAALGSLLTALATYGLITDSSSA
jgi:hypothetical protein